MMYGSSTRAASGKRASAKPAVTPRPPPRTSPSADSSSVTSRCRHKVPIDTHVQMRRAISLGLLTKKGSITRAAAAASHPLRKTIATPARQAATADRSDTGDLCLALDDFLAKHRPDRAVDRFKRRRGAQIEQIARPLQLDHVSGDDAARGAGRQDDDLVGERDRFVEIVRY